MGMKFKVSLRADKLYQHLEDKSPAAVQAALEKIKEATDPLTPRETGELIDSGYIQDGTIAYTAPYAARQHEELSYNHPNGGGAKYLERGIRAGAKEAKQAIAEIMEF